MLRLKGFTTKEPNPLHGRGSYFSPTTNRKYYLDHARKTYRGGITVDFTPIAEFLYQCVDRTVRTDLENELDFLNRYDVIKRQIKEVVDMPDRRIDLFIKCVRQNNGSLSARKRSSWFKMLTEAEVDQMENIINKNTR